MVMSYYEKAFTWLEYWEDNFFGLKLPLWYTETSVLLLAWLEKCEQRRSNIIFPKIHPWCVFGLCIHVCFNVRLQAAVSLPSPWGGCSALLFKGCLHGDRCGSSPWRWIELDVGRQGRGPRTRQEWLQPPRQEIEEEHSKEGSRGKRCNFTSQITSGMEERKISQQ